MLKAREWFNPQLVVLIILKMTSHSHVCIARREQFMACKASLVFTDLALARIIKQRKKTGIQCWGTVSVHGYQRIHPQWLAILFWKKLLTKCVPNIWSSAWIPALSGSLCTDSVYGRRLHEKSSGVSEGACLLDEDGDGFACSLIAREGAWRSPAQGWQQVPVGGSSSSAWEHWIQSLGTLWGCCLACQGWTKVLLCLQRGW